LGPIGWGGNAGARDREHPKQMVVPTNATTTPNTRHFIDPNGVPDAIAVPFHANLSSISGFAPLCGDRKVLQFHIGLWQNLQG
jgi:hypothetical protein